jgi:hypothetical protein
MSQGLAGSTTKAHLIQPQNVFCGGSIHVEEQVSRIAFVVYRAVEGDGCVGQLVPRLWQWFNPVFVCILVVCEGRKCLVQI